jgi:eukaryotic-like serine/threonine-protein kinase
MTDKSFHNRIKEIFSEALELPEAERLQYLTQTCGDDKDLRSEVESLLASFEKSEEFIETPAFSVNQITQQTTQFGNYKIIKEIGQGGMGTVYLAERSDGQFEQKVAIKIVRQTYADSEIIRRFKNERQILAKLQHPNIASLLDGGINESGQPFLAMEYVEGKNIAEFCKDLSVKNRLKLFLKVCKGVAYAHRNLVIHRDIKPSNILVNHENEPKLLDFGLAKLSEKDSHTTQTGMRALTPAYASPEQLKGETITTASDIYSLGVVLYELFTETRPFETDGKSFEEIVRTVTIIEPVLPSRNPQSAIRIC